jgi:hypothetical protein
LTAPPRPAAVGGEAGWEAAVAALRQRVEMGSKASAGALALRVAMTAWRGWADESRGAHPIELGGAEREGWLACEQVLGEKLR